MEAAARLEQRETSIPKLGSRAGARGQPRHHPRGVKGPLLVYQFIFRHDQQLTQPAYTSSPLATCIAIIAVSPPVAATLSPNPRPSCAQHSRPPHPHTQLGGARLPHTSKWNTRLRMTCTAVRAAALWQRRDRYPFRRRQEHRARERATIHVSMPACQH